MPRTLRLACIVFTVTLATLNAPLAASSIGVYFAPDASDCDATQPLFTSLTWYVLAVLDGDVAQCGITGAEFSVTGVPQQWSHTATANPDASIAIGNPLVDGCDIAFANCQTGTNGVVLLYTITSFSTSSLTNLVYEVRPRPFSGPGFPCVILFLCDAPVFTSLCVARGEGFVNGGSCTALPAGPPDCPPLGVEPRTWTGVKRLYGN